MIDWLERCQKQNWRLVVDQDSLPDALERQVEVRTESNGQGLRQKLQRNRTRSNGSFSVIAFH
nr:hypothetical protein [uncultured Rhodopila sp.]